jgi:hypothetical protein
VCWAGNVCGQGRTVVARNKAFADMRIALRSRLKLFRKSDFGKILALILIIAAILDCLPFILIAR